MYIVCYDIVYFLKYINIFILYVCILCNIINENMNFVIVKIFNLIFNLKLFYYKLMIRKNVGINCY